MAIDKNPPVKNLADKKKSSINVVRDNKMVTVDLGNVATNGQIVIGDPIKETLRNAPDDFSELLAGCEGMTFYYTNYGDCKIDDMSGKYIILCDPVTNNIVDKLRKDGKKSDDGECLLFPSKDQRDWRKFKRPFEPGDYIFSSGKLCIFKGFDEDGYIDTYVAISAMDDLEPNTLYVNDGSSGKMLVKMKDFRKATQSEIDQINLKMDAEGYRWDPVKKESIMLKWKPRKGFTYYTLIIYADLKYIVTSSIWNDSKLDNELWINGNCWKEYKDAQSYADKLNNLTNNFINKEIKWRN